jgi:predicted transcriptional regulator YheO
MELVKVVQQAALVATNTITIVMFALKIISFLCINMNVNLANLELIVLLHVIVDAKLALKMAAASPAILLLSYIPIFALVVNSIALVA